MMHIQLKPANIVACAALLAPVLLFQSVKYVFGASGPAASQAASMPSDSTVGMPGVIGSALIASPAKPALAPAQAEAVGWIRQQSSVAVISSPFPKRTESPTTEMSVVVAHVQEQPDQPDQPKEPALSDVPDEVRSLMISGILRSASGVFVTMSGKAFAVGDVVTEGWTITAIDPENRVVTITGHAGLVVTIEQPLSGQ
jgi:hypothetical protein